MGRTVICRTSRKCGHCGEDINPGDEMKMRITVNSVGIITLHVPCEELSYTRDREIRAARDSAIEVRTIDSEEPVYLDSRKGES